MNTNYKPNRLIENDIFETDTRPAAVEDIWDYLKPGNHRRDPNGKGLIVYRNRYQYIRDKLQVFQDEMLCTILKVDVEHLIYECTDISSIDAYCRAIYDRCWPSESEVPEDAETSKKVDV